MVAKEIQLTRGLVAVVDAEDYERVVERGRWTADPRRTVTYAFHSFRLNGKRVNELLHRFIMQAPAGVEVDHKDGDGLNCRRANLRLVTHQQNAMNRRLARGISWRPERGCWRAYIKLDQQQHELGCFPSQDEASAARSAAVAASFGEFAPTAGASNE